MMMLSGAQLGYHQEHMFCHDHDQLCGEDWTSSTLAEYPVPYTHVHTDGKSKSTIDHFLMSPRLVPLVSECGVVERGDNLSRHCPIWVKLQIGSLPVRPSASRTWISKRPCWSKASTSEMDEYTAQLHSKLLSLQVPESVWCTDPHCSDTVHCQDRDELVLDMLDCVVKASHTSLPTWW